MRYAGGGVGHYRVTLSDTPANPDETPQEDFAMDDEEAEHILDDNIEDHCSDSEDEEEDEGPDEGDLGAEDGEGGFFDAEDDEGYAAL